MIPRVSVFFCSTIKRINDSPLVSALRVLWAATVLLCALAPTFALAVGTPIPSAPVMWCTDKAGFLSDQAEHKIDFLLFDYERQSGHQVIVYIAKTTGGVSIEEWAAKGFKAWGIGKKGKDDGVALFVFSEDQTLRIEVGYGLEGNLPDAICSRIINEIMVPKIHSGDHDGAIENGVKAILAATSGQPIAWTTGEDETAEQPKAPEPQPTVVTQGLSTWQLVLIVILGIGFLILLVTHPSITLWLLVEIIFSAASGDGGGGGGGGGGGFSGGGGSSGGGGASGSW